MRNCLKQGVGYSICPEVAVQKELANGSLRRLNWTGETLETSVIMIWHAEKWCSPLQTYFMDLCETVISRPKQ